MKKFSKQISIALACVCAFATMGVACGPREDDVKVDSTKMQLYVGQEANGFGEEWLDQTVAAFEEEMKDHEFSNGKKGVQVIVSHTGYTGMSYVNKIKTDSTDVIFSEKAYYYDFLSKNSLMDITEAVTTPLTEFGETESIVDKLKINTGTQVTDALTGADGKYYAMPWWTGLQGITYDVDLFNDKNFYFAKGGAPSEYERSNANCDPALSGTFSNYAYTNLAGERSAGPDGKYGTYDDGLPATYDEFFALCDQMVKNGVTPLIWTGQYQYGDMIIRELFHDYEGLDNINLLYETNGTAYDLVEDFELNANGTVNFDSITYKGGSNGIKIDFTNGYEMHAQVGKLYALSFAKRLLSNKDYYSEKCFDIAFSHKNAQRYYLYSKYDSSYETVAMVADYTCFMNEAASVFTEMEGVYDKSGRYERALGLMPLPKANASKIGEVSTAMSRQSAMCFINGNITDPVEKELAITFFRFCHTDDMLKLFNKVSGGIRPFDFSYTDEEYADLDNYAKSTYFASSTYDIFHPIRYNQLWVNNMSYFCSNTYGWESTVKGGQSKMFKTFKDHGDVSVKDYFNGILGYYTKDQWDNRMSEYY